MATNIEKTGRMGEYNMSTCGTNEQCVEKPHITKHYRLLDGKVYYKCSTNKWEAYGGTPIGAYEMWNSLSNVREWVAQ